VKLYPDMVEKTLDEREFAHNAEHYGYSPERRKKIEKTKDEVLHLIDQRAFPFQNAEIERLFQTFLDRNRPQN
jgi:protein associated with RNAse G/E